MLTTLYFIRHAQSNPRHSLDNSEYPLTDVGKKQAEQLVPLLEQLDLQHMYCSPFVRCIHTIQPFVNQSDIEVSTHVDLREKRTAVGLIRDFDRVWERSWADFSFALPACESSHQAIGRFVRAVASIVKNHPSKSVGVSSHGHVIGLFLNRLHSSFGGDETQDIRHPDIIKVSHREGQFEWDRDFEVPGLSEIATDYSHTSVGFPESQDEFVVEGTTSRRTGL